VRLLQFLNIQPKYIGQIGGGKRKPTGKIDIAVIQSLSRKGVVDNIVADYGYIIIDECHHISAPSFEAIVRQFKGKYITGLSATVVRKDGHHPIIFMNCGPIRYKVCAKEQSNEKPFQHKLIVYNTDFRLPLNLDCSARVAISDLYNALIVDIKRNSKIVEDVMNNIYEGRFLMLLTERREHLDYFREIFCDRIKNLVMFKGGMNKKQIVVAMDNLKSIPENEPALILATGRYIGEGFDESRIDTLFLGLPVSWKGTIIQYAGRLNRLHRNKKEVRIYDYVDRNVPMSARMFERRLKGYRAIGYNYDGDWLPRKPAWLK
jgi:superfamily II DNA or RNA helicase